MIKEAIGVAATIEEARKMALENLHAPVEADVKVEIVTFPKKKVLGLFGGVDFSDMKWVIGTKEVTDATTGAVTVVENSINYGAFVTGVINFLIMALVIFCMVKLVAAVSGWSKKLAKKGEEEAVAEEAPAAPIETTDDILKDIRELLKTKETTK